MGRVRLTRSKFGYFNETCSKSVLLKKKTRRLQSIDRKTSHLNSSSSEWSRRKRLKMYDNTMSRSFGESI